MGAQKGLQKGHRKPRTSALVNGVLVYAIIRPWSASTRPDGRNPRKDVDLRQGRKSRNTA